MGVGVGEGEAHLEVLAARDGELLVVVGGARVRHAHHAPAARRHAARPRLAQLVWRAQLKRGGIILK